MLFGFVPIPLKGQFNKKIKDIECSLPSPKYNGARWSLACSAQSTKRKTQQQYLCEET